MNLLLSVGLLIFLPIYSFAANSGDDADVAIEDVVNNTITEIVVKDVSKNNESYWTQEKLNQVKPYPIPTVHPTKKHSHYRYEHVNSSQTDASSNRSRRASEDVWTNREIEDSKPAPLPSLSNSDLEALGIKPAIKLKSVRVQVTKTKVEKADVNDEMFKPMGKLLFVDNTGAHYQCSAQYVSEYIVMTAGHCVYSVETEGWNNQFKFIQNYVGQTSRLSSSRHEGTPRRVTKAIVGKKWFSGGKENFAYDFAFLAMKDPSVGGYYNIEYPESFDTWVNAGYPSNFAKGQLLHKFAGRKGAVTNDIVETPGNPMGPGCSGGAWIATKSAQNYVVGVNSFSFEGRESMFSPHFNQARIKAVLDKTKQVLGQTTE